LFLLELIDLIFWDGSEDVPLDDHSRWDR
jgi:hypothetical protein